MRNASSHRCDIAALPIPTVDDYVTISHASTITRRLSAGPGGSVSNAFRMFISRKAIMPRNWSRAAAPPIKAAGSGWCSRAHILPDDEVEQHGIGEILCGRLAEVDVVGQVFGTVITHRWCIVHWSLGAPMSGFDRARTASGGTVFRRKPGNEFLLAKWWKCF